MSTYAVVLEQEADGGYSVYAPDLAGCASMGDTLDEALANIREAIACHIEGMKADGLAVPAPRGMFLTTVQVEAA